MTTATAKTASRVKGRRTRRTLMASKQASQAHPYLVQCFCIAVVRRRTSVGLCACSLLLLRKKFMACKKPIDEHLNVFQFASSARKQPTMAAWSMLSFISTEHHLFTKIFKMHTIVLLMQKCFGGGEKACFWVVFVL